MRHFHFVPGVSAVGSAHGLNPAQTREMRSGTAATGRPKTPLRVSALLASGLVAAPSWSWDATPTSLGVYQDSGNASIIQGVAAAVASGTSFDEGTPLLLRCQYKYLDDGGANKSPSWQIEFTVDGKSVGGVQAVPGPETYIESHTSSNCKYVVAGCSSTTTNVAKMVNETHLAQVKWLAVGEGTRTVQCHLNPKKAPGETNPYNNIAQETITVKRVKPLAGGELPSVQLQSPPEGSSFFLVPGVQIQLFAKVTPQPTGGKANLIEYAKLSPFEEKWHIEIVRRGSGPLSGFESKVGEFTGPLKDLKFGAQLTYAWLQQHGSAKTGSYAARAYVAQNANGSVVTGPNSRVEFELKEPVSARLGAQPQIPAVGASPPPSVILPPPAQPTGRLPSPQPPLTAPVAPAGSVQPMPVLPNLPAVQQPAERRAR